MTEELLRNKPFPFSKPHLQISMIYFLSYRNFTRFRKNFFSNIFLLYGFRHYSFEESLIILSLFLSSKECKKSLWSYRLQETFHCFIHSTEHTSFKAIWKVGHDIFSISDKGTYAGDFLYSWRYAMNFTKNFLNLWSWYFLLRWSINL